MLAGSAAVFEAASAMRRPMPRGCWPYAGWPDPADGSSLDRAAGLGLECFRGNALPMQSGQVGMPRLVIGQTDEPGSCPTARHDLLQAILQLQVLSGPGWSRR